MVTTVSTGVNLNRIAEGVNRRLSMVRVLTSGRRAVLFNPPGGVNNALRSGPACAWATAEIRRYAPGAAYHGDSMGGLR